MSVVIAVLLAVWALLWGLYRQDKARYRDSYVAPKPRPGDYGVTHTGGFVGWCIRVGTRSHFNHAFVYLGQDSLGRDLIIEATPRGAIISPLSRYPHARFNSRTDTLDDATRQKIVAAAYRLKGTPYGFTDIAVLALACAGIHWRWVDDRVNREDRLICSQLVTVAYNNAGVSLTDKLPCEVTPQDLFARLNREDQG